MESFSNGFLIGISIVVILLGSQGPYESAKSSFFLSVSWFS